MKIQRAIYANIVDILALLRVQEVARRVLIKNICISGSMEEIIHVSFAGIQVPLPVQGVVQKVPTENTNIFDYFSS